MRDFVNLGGKLFIISAITALVLAWGNSITSEKIKATSEEANKQARMQVLEGAGKIDTETAQRIGYKKKDSSVEEIIKYQTEDGGVVFAVSCSPRGYGGEISMMVGVDEDLSVISVKITDNSGETPGLGAKTGNVEFYGQFAGKSKNIAISKKPPADNEVQAIAGATISSRAVVKGVNDAISAAEEVLNK